LDCGGDPAQFMAAALDFANNRCWGTLSCSVFAHPTTQVRGAAHAETLALDLPLKLRLHPTRLSLPPPLLSTASNLSRPALPAVQRKQQAAFDELVAGLRYGAIAVNVPSLLSFVMTKLGWGAFPGSTRQVGTAGQRLCQLLLCAC
jgi:hypothetical protein